MKLTDGLRVLAGRRRQLDVVKKARIQEKVWMLASLHGKLYTERDEEYKDLEKSCGSLAKIIQEQAVELYARAARIFGKGVDKKHWPGVEIKEFNVYRRIAGDAVVVTWAERHAPILVKKRIDDGALKEMTKAGLIPDWIARMEVEPRAQISSKLEEKLSE